jgi:hypothetical protein
VRNFASVLKVKNRPSVSEQDEGENILTEGWGNLHNEELHNLFSSPSITRMMKSTRIRWKLHVARMRIIEIHMGYWW